MGPSQRKYLGVGLLALAGLWNLGLLPHAPRLVLSGKPTWAELRDPQTQASPLELRLQGVASLIAGRPVAVRCTDLSDLGNAHEPGGVVRFSGDTPANWTRLRPDICAQLARLLRDGGRGGAPEARAVEVLAHESFHLRGVKNEAAAECYAVQFVAYVAERLGVKTVQAAALHTRAVDAYPYQSPEYLSAECRPGGALDLHGVLARAA